MDRRDVESYLRENPPESRVDVKALLDQCEHTVRRHAREDAWLAAKEYALDRARRWQGQWSAPASERFVTAEVCHELARELKHHEPEVVPGAEEHLAGGPVREALSDEAWRRLSAWVREMAAEEEHRAWREIVRYTDRCARRIIRREGFTRDSGWDAEHQYAALAAHVARILAHDYSLHAHPR